jgi:hypothetical protein
MRKLLQTKGALGIVLIASVLCLTETLAFSQLTPNCTVSMQNRTARVKADGSWRIANVPTTNQGVRVRARATCVQNGETRSGQSSFVLFASDTTNAFDADISLTAPEPVPVNVTLMATAVKMPIERNLLKFQ